MLRIRVPYYFYCIFAFETVTISKVISMKHQKFEVGKEFNYVCHEGGNQVYLYASVSQRTMYKDIDVFFNQMDEHGYDVLTPKDGFAYEMALQMLNDAVRKQAIRDNLASYKRFTSAMEEVCRCGKWVFLKYLPFVDAYEEMSLDEKSRGGARKNAGRKGQYGKLKYGETAVIRVPATKKDDIKALIDWLIEKESEGQDVRSALFSGKYLLEDYAEQNKDYFPEKAQQRLEKAKLLSELYDLLPRFYVKEDGD